MEQTHLFKQLIFLNSPERGYVLHSVSKLTLEL